MGADIVFCVLNLMAVILYRVPEILSDDVEDRKAGDMAFFHEFYDKGLKITMSNGDIEQMYRLGKREQDKVRPLLVKFKDEEIKRKVIGMAKGLKLARPRYKEISIAHDFDPDIIAISESWTNESIGDSELNLTGYTLFRKDRELDIKGGGVLLYVMNCLNASKVKFKSDFPEQVWCKVFVMGIQNSLLE